jgi:hypothetical protein
MIIDQFVKARALAGSHHASKDNQPTARIDFEILEGPNSGEKITYNGRIDTRSAKYVARDLKAVGWKGKTLETLAEDVDRTKAETTIEIKVMNRKDGSGSFAVVRSIGRTDAASQVRPVPAAELANANALLRDALGEDEPVDVANSEDIPF